MSGRSRGVSIARSARARAGAAVLNARRRRLEGRLAAPRLLAVFADANPRASFVEIGSNDGEQHDHLRTFIVERDWTGIMVEPVPYVFERLRSNYGHIERIALENAAVADRDGELPFYYVSDASEEERRTLPSWYDGIGSFSKPAVLSHAAHIPDIERRLVCRPVRTLTFDALCERHRVTHLDLLLVDTEGLDWEILRTIDFGAWRPQLVVYEHYHLSAVDRRDCAAHLRGCGYSTMEEGFDTLCLHEAVGGRVRTAWNRLRPAVSGVAKYEEAR